MKTNQMTWYAALPILVSLLLSNSYRAEAQTYQGEITHGSSSQYTFDFYVICGTPATTAEVVLEYSTAEPPDLTPQLHLGGGMFVSMSGPSPYTYTLTGLTDCDFSFEFYLAYQGGGLYQSPTPHTEDNTNLPVELLRFEASHDADGSVLLDWVSVSEINSDYFGIERSTDGADWDFVAQVDAAGNSSNTLHYTAIDDHPRYSSDGITYYRLKMVDTDGSYEYSPIRSLKRMGREVSLSLFPNPADNVLIMDFSEVDWFAGGVELRVYNPQGGQVHAVSFLHANQTEMSLANFPSSVYFFQFIQGDGMIYQTKVVKE